MLQTVKRYVLRTRLNTGQTEENHILSIIDRAIRIYPCMILCNFAKIRRLPLPKQS